VFSLNPVPGYAPATLAGHKEGLVGVFWSGPTTQAAAALAGQGASHLYTVSRDGALFGWHHSGLAAAAAAPAARGGGGAAAGGAAEEAAGSGSGESSGSGSGSGSGEESEEDAEAPPPLAQGAWSVAFKHYFMQRGAKLSCADFHK
jgi:periodic tryptophan protein 2